MNTNFRKYAYIYIYIYPSVNLYQRTGRLGEVCDSVGLSKVLRVWVLGVQGLGLRGFRV